jgi:hypothetical protein
LSRLGIGGESDQASQRQYQAGDISGYKATPTAMGDMAKRLERKQDLGIQIESGRRLGL